MKGYVIEKFTRVCGRKGTEKFDSYITAFGEVVLDTNSLDSTDLFDSIGDCEECIIDLLLNGTDNDEVHFRPVEVLV